MFTLIIEISEIKHGCMVRNIDNDLCKMCMTKTPASLLEEEWGRRWGGVEGTEWAGMKEN